jgi:hypothetical protein
MLRQEGLDGAHAAVRGMGDALVLWCSGALGFFVLCGGGLDDRDERRREQSADTGGVVGACWVGQASILSEIGGSLPKSTPDTSSRASVQTDKGATRPQRRGVPRS